MNLENKIDLIREAKDNIKAALISKGATPSGNITTYASAINSLRVPNNQTLNTITANGTYRYDSDYTGFDNFTVNVNQSTETKTITENGTYTPTSGKIGFSSVSVNVQANLGTKTITENGTYIASSDSVDGYSSVIVNAPTGIPREVKNGVFQIPNESFTFSLPSNATNLGAWALSAAFRGSDISSADLSSLTTITGEGALSATFRGSDISSINLSNLTTINARYALENAFAECENLTSIDLSSLTTITSVNAMSNAFRGSSITEIDLSNLTTISGTNAMSGAFLDCDNLNEIEFTSLNQLNSSQVLSYMCANNNNMEIYFPALNSNSFNNGWSHQFRDMLNGSTSCTVHFPSNLESVIGSWADIRYGLGGTLTTILWDLPATT